MSESWGLLVDKETTEACAKIDNENVTSLLQSELKFERKNTTIRECSPSDQQGLRG